MYPIGWLVYFSTANNFFHLKLCSIFKISNHDQHRAVDRLGPKRGDLLNIMVQTLPGIAVTYYGEEIVMHDVYIGWEDTVDPLACNQGPEKFYALSRDPARTPFQWDDTGNAGFSNANSTWLPGI
jgi:alpha-glucosidase